MSDPTDVTPSSTPRQLWIVGVLALLWSSVGAYDYLMTQTENAAYMAKFTPEMLAFYYGFPTWVIATWAIAVWGGVAGSVLLLMRRRLAAPVYLASLLAMVVTTFHNYVLSDGFEHMGDPFSLIFTAVIFVVAVLLYGYASNMVRRGVLT
jgi:hypothetical protein